MLSILEQTHAGMHVTYCHMKRRATGSMPVDGSVNPHTIDECQNRTTARCSGFY
jgi:hypothetical protein